MRIAIGNRRTDKVWKNINISWFDFVTLISKTKRTAETVDEYRKLLKSKQDDIKDVGGFVGGYLKDGKRKNGFVEARSMLTLDMDYAPPLVWENTISKLPYVCAIYSTHKHTPDNPRIRVIFPLEREISEDEYPAVARAVANEISIDYFDDTTYEPARLMYFPSTSYDGEFIIKDKGGVLLDPDIYLAKYDDWRDTTKWFVSNRQKEIIKRNIKKQADPLLKDGLIGAFCKTYTISEAIDKFLEDVYEPSIIPERYSYIPADSTSGVVLYDDKFAYSHHATDPACSQLLNAFDLVRIHKFSHLDEKSEAKSPSQLPSFKAMTEFALKDNDVKIQLSEERSLKAKKEFKSNEWKAELEYDKKGTIKNTLRNLILILENDEKLKSIVFNEFSDGMEIKNGVPWQHPSKFWRNADDAQLISYIDREYGYFTTKNCEIAVTKVTDDRSYHPIKEYFSSLPKWDEIKRVDTLLIDYLGANDNEYIRAVTRKTLCAAVKRVLSPGIKFDTMLVLNGPQGIGKSTLISKLAGEWFSDSLILSDTKDKTAAEKLQGYWIIEIGELAGLRKAEVETLRSFLSRQNDIYRASFGRHATPHPRQCIFFGTTNAENGYLRDTTGNRRFWPVKTPGCENKKSWSITQNEVDQIWAEALIYVQNNESLELPHKIEILAKNEQREALEADEREGLVREYLNKLLPENWNNMSLFERRNFLDGCDFGETNLVGTVKRTTVSNVEIWCECFSKEQSNLKRADSNEIISIMSKIEGWTGLEKRVRLKIYGLQRVYTLVKKQ